jgi:hypothetical protein
VPPAALGASTWRCCRDCPSGEGEGPKGADDSLAPETEDKGAVNQAKAGEILLGELTYGR